MAEIDKWHRQRGFDRVGYHFVIEEDGRVKYGRRSWVQGAHDLGQNVDSLGVCVTGMGSEWSVRQEEALLDLMRACLLVYGPDFSFEMHRENELPESPTECPGITESRWHELLDAL